jgi:hypothetical protein
MTNNLDEDFRAFVANEGRDGLVKTMRDQLSGDQHQIVKSLSDQVDALNAKLGGEPIAKDAEAKQDLLGGLEYALNELETKLEEVELKAAKNIFEEHVQEVKDADGCSTLMAMAKARKLWPEDFKNYQADGILKAAQQDEEDDEEDDDEDVPEARKAKQPEDPSEEVEDEDDPGNHPENEFDDLVDRISQQQSIPRSDAMVEARRLNPSAYAAYNAATNDVPQGSRKPTWKRAIGTGGHLSPARGDEASGPLGRGFLPTARRQPQQTKKPPSGTDALRAWRLKNPAAFAKWQAGA